MLQSHQRLFHRSVLIVDLTWLGAGAAIAAGAAVAQNHGVPPASGLPWTSLLVETAALLTAWFALSSRLGLYRSHRTAPAMREFEALVASVVGSIALATLSGHVLGTGPVFEPGTWLLSSGLGLLLWRTAIRVALREGRRRGKNFRRAVIVGGGTRADALAAEVADNSALGIRLLGYVAFSKQREPVAELATLGSVADLQSIVAGGQGEGDAARADVVIICPPPNATSAEIEQVVELCAAAGIACQFAPDFLPLDARRAELSFYGSIPALSPAPRGRSNLQYVLKSAFDFTFALLAIVLASPVMMALAIAIRLDSKGPVFFRQQRVGRGGKSFPCFKFRTMQVDAEAQRAALEAHNEQDGPVFKMQSDPRITRLGAFLRKYSLDELPQLFNVLRGEMSLVGPRPPIPEEVTRYEWWQRRRVAVRPGLTCIWQTQGRNRVSFQEWMEMDLDYLENWSLWLDFKILCNTAGTVLRGTGV